MARKIVYKIYAVVVTCLVLIASVGATEDCCRHDSIMLVSPFALNSGTNRANVLPSLQEMMCRHKFESMVGDYNHGDQPSHGSPCESNTTPKPHVASCDEQSTYSYANRAVSLPSVQRTNSMLSLARSQPSRLNLALLTQAFFPPPIDTSPTQYSFDEDCPSRRNRMPTVDVCVEASKEQNPNRPPRYPVSTFEDQARKKLSGYLSLELRSNLPQELYRIMSKPTRDELFKVQPLSAQKLAEVRRRISEQHLVIVIYADPHSRYEIDFKVLYNPVRSGGCDTLAEVIQRDFAVAKIISVDTGYRSDDFIWHMRKAVDEKNKSNLVPYG